MKKEYVELVISAPFFLVKGFLMGFLEGRGKESVYFFSRRTGIRTETLGETLKEWMGFENLVHLCVEKDLALELEIAFKNTYKKIGMDIQSQKEIKSANFEFEVELYSEKQRKEFKKVLDSLPEGLFVDEFKENLFKEGEDKPEVGSYAADHHYVYNSKGHIVGEFEDLIRVFLQFKDNPMVELSEVFLNF